MLDYLTALLVILSPWIFQFADDDPATAVPLLVGIVTIFYSLITNYEYSIATAIPFRVHLVLDTLLALFLAVSPWLLGFSEKVYLPHLLLGIAELTIVMISRGYADLPRQRNHQHA